MAAEKKRHKNKFERGFTQENGPSIKPKESRRSIKIDPFVYTDSGNFSDENNLTIEQQFYGLADDEMEYHEVASKKRKKLKPVEIEYTLEFAKENVQEKEENDQPKRKEQKHHKRKNEIDFVTVENQDEQTVGESVSSGHKKKKNIDKNYKIEDNNQKVKKAKNNDYGKLEERLKCSPDLEEKEMEQEIQARNKAVKKKKVRADEPDDENEKVKKRKKHNDPEEFRKIHHHSITEVEKEQREEIHNKRKKTKTDDIAEMEAEIPKVKKNKKKKTRNDTEELEEMCRDSSNSVPEEEQEEAPARNHGSKKKKKKVDAEDLEETEVETLQYSVAEEEEEEAQRKSCRRKKKNIKVDEWEDENQTVKEKKKRRDPRGSEEIRPNLVPEEQEDEHEQEEVHARNNERKKKKKKVVEAECKNQIVKKKKRNDAEELEETEVETLQYSVAEEEEVQAKKCRRKKKNNKVDEWQNDNQKVKENKKRNDSEGSEDIRPNLVTEEQNDELEQEEVQARNDGRKKKKKKFDEAECKKQLVKTKKRNDAEELEESEVETLQYSVGEEAEEEEEGAHVTNSRRKKKNNKVDEWEDENQKVKENEKRNDPERTKNIRPNLVPEEQEDAQEQEVQAGNNRMENKRIDETDDENQKVKKRKKQISPERIQQDSFEKTGGCETIINIESSDDALSTSGEEDSEEYKRLLSSLINKQRKILNCISEEINDLDQEVEAGPSIIDEINRNIRKHAKVSRKFVEDCELERVAKNRRKLRTVVDPSEELPKKLAENALSRDQARILAKLNIYVPWQPAPLHLIETGIVRSPTAEQLKEISKQKLEVKKNAFSAEEDKILMNNWRNFCRLHDLDADPAVFLKLKHLDVKNLRPKHRLNFARSLARNLDNRLLVSVYNRFKRICSKEKLNTGRFTKAEDEMILNYLQSSGQMNISKLALILNRDFRAVRDRANALTKPKNPLVFTDCELKKFVRELMKTTAVLDVQELKNKEINSECWHEVSSNLNIPVKNLRKTWQLVAYPRLFMHESCDTRALKENLIKRIQDSTAKNYDEIDWEQLASCIDGFTPQLLHKMFKEIVEYYVPQPFKQSLTNALIYLQNAVVAKHKFRTGRRFKPLHV